MVLITYIIITTLEVHIVLLVDSLLISQVYMGQILAETALMAYILCFGLITDPTNQKWYY